MPTRNVSLTDELDKFVASKVEAGRYANASEVMRTALRNLQEDDREYEAKMAALEAALAEGDACDPADDVDEEGLVAHLEVRIKERAAKRQKAAVA
jgi:antitoxin ParD1/3/4